MRSDMFDPEKIKKDFPIFKTKINSKSLVYLDSAATTQKPAQVIERISDFYCHENANVARGLHTLAERSTLSFENVRDRVSRFIHAEMDEVLFTSGATASLNAVMRGWGEKNIKAGDKIVTTVMEHHSDFVPWQQLAKMKRARFEVVDITDDGELNMHDFEKKVKSAKLVAFSGASNVLGTVNDARKLCAIASDEGAVTVVDGAQSVPSLHTDVKKIGCDFLAFSGHKMLGPFGCGVLYGRREILEKMDPFLYGSEMIRTVYLDRSEWNDLPDRMESGTPDVAAFIGLGAALDYLHEIGGMEAIEKHEQMILAYALKRLSEIPNLRILGPNDPKKRVSLVSFTLDGKNPIHPHDVAALLDERGIAVRSGHHCAMPLHTRFGIPASTRASFYIYNTKSDVDKLIDGIDEVKKVFS